MQDGLLRRVACRATVRTACACKILRPSPGARTGVEHHFGVDSDPPQSPSSGSNLDPRFPAIPVITTTGFVGISSASMVELVPPEAALVGSRLAADSAVAPAAVSEEEPSADAACVAALDALQPVPRVLPGQSRLR